MPEVFSRLETWIAVEAWAVSCTMPISFENCHSRVYFPPWNTTRWVVKLIPPVSMIVGFSWPCT